MGRLGLSSRETLGLRAAAWRLGRALNEHAAPTPLPPRQPPPPLQADKLLSPEFQPLIEQLISFLPEERQVMLFSATFPVTVKARTHRRMGHHGHVPPGGA